MGVTLLKLWPIETLGGIPYLQLLAGPFAGVEFNPSGGLTSATFESYLALKNVVACGGPWMAPAEWIAAKQFDKITAAVRDSVTRATKLTPARLSPATPRPAIREAAPPR
jgi:2-dehydro-3-deoxyphosphogluconate aldolase/(4S)-4-hydroxy-2-oxoglutarate aldolase